MARGQGDRDHCGAAGLGGLRRAVSAVLLSGRGQRSRAPRSVAVAHPGEYGGAVWSGCGAGADAVELRQCRMAASFTWPGPRTRPGHRSVGPTGQLSARLWLSRRDW